MYNLRSIYLFKVGWFFIYNLSRSSFFAPVMIIFEHKNVIRENNLYRLPCRPLGAALDNVPLRVDSDPVIVGLEIAAPATTAAGAARVRRLVTAAGADVGEMIV